MNLVAALWCIFMPLTTYEMTKLYEIQMSVYPTVSTSPWVGDNTPSVGDNEQARDNTNDQYHYCLIKLEVANWTAMDVHQSKCPTARALAGCFNRVATFLWTTLMFNCGQYVLNVKNPWEIVLAQPPAFGHPCYLVPTLSVNDINCGLFCCGSASWHRR